MAPANIIVFRALPGLGDFLCAVPALRALRLARPESSVHLVGLAETEPLAQRFARYVDRFHAFPGHEALPEQRPPTATARRAFEGTMRGLRADLALQLHGSGETTNDIVAGLGARRIAGFVREGDAAPAGGPFLAWDEAEPEPRRWLRLLRAAGIPASDDRLEFPPTADAAAGACALLVSPSGAAWAVVHPGSARPLARWSVDGFRAVGRGLVARGLRVVVTGTDDETRLTAAVADAVPGALDLGGRTDLDQLSGLVAGARLVVANDTGVGHLATALGTSSVVVFGAGDEAHVRRWAPLDPVRHRAVPPPATVGAVLTETDRLLATAGAAA